MREDGNERSVRGTIFCEIGTDQAIMQQTTTALAEHDLDQSVLPMPCVGLSRHTRPSKSHTKKLGKDRFIQMMCGGQIDSDNAVVMHESANEM